jgi:hypothetical protein
VWISSSLRALLALRCETRLGSSHTTGFVAMVRTIAKPERLVARVSDTIEEAMCSDNSASPAWDQL